MQKDFKIGMVLGVVLVTVAIVWLSTRPSLSIRARALNSYSPERREMGIPSNSQNIEPRKEASISGNPATQTNNEQLKETKSERFHVVRAGETLSDISRQYYGSADKWQKILGTDHLPIENPSKIRPGMKLIIPD
jgi:nucleoid-associated protein YgaU